MLKLLGICSLLLWAHSTQAFCSHSLSSLTERLMLEASIPSSLQPHGPTANDLVIKRGCTNLSQSIFKVPLTTYSQQWRMGTDVREAATGEAISMVVLRCQAAAGSLVLPLHPRLVSHHTKSSHLSHCIRLLICLYAKIFLFQLL